MGTLPETLGEEGQHIVRENEGMPSSRVAALRKKGETSMSMMTNERALMIVHRVSGLALYSHVFTRGERDPQLLSGFVGAMTMFLGEALGSEDSGWKTVYGSDTTLIVELGEWTAAVLVVSRDYSLLHNKVRIVVAEFETTFQAFKNVESFEGGVPDAFDEFVMRTFVEEKISEDTRVLLAANREDCTHSRELADERSSIVRLLPGNNDSMSIADFADSQNVSFDRAKEVIMRAYWHGVIDLRYIPSTADILKPTETSLSVLLSDGNPFSLSRSAVSAVGNLDGRRTLHTILGQWGLDEEEVLPELGSLVTRGFLQKTTPEHNSVLAYENILNLFLGHCKSLVSEMTLSVALLMTLLNGIMVHPWLSCVRIRSGVNVECILDENMSPCDYGHLYDALQYVINEISRRLSVIINTVKIEEAFDRARMCSLARHEHTLANTVTHEPDLKEPN